MSKKEEIIREFRESGQSQRVIAEQFGVSRGLVTQYCKGIERSIPLAPKHPCSNRFFEAVQTEAQAYWVGFLLGDGSISGNCLSVTLLNEDRWHLENLAKLMGTAERPKVSTAPSLQKFANSYCTFRVSNKQLVDDLAALNVVPNKTLVADLPLKVVSEDLHRHLIRGVFDADGCLGTYKKKVKKPTWYPWLPTVSLCGSPDMIKTIEQVVQRDLGFSVPIQKRSSNYHILETKGWVKAAQLADYLYEDCSHYLARKMVKYQEMKDKQPLTSKRFVGSALKKETQEI